MIEETLLCHKPFSMPVRLSGACTAQHTFMVQSALCHNRDSGMHAWNDIIAVQPQANTWPKFRNPEGKLGEDGSARD